MRARNLATLVLIAITGSGCCTIDPEPPITLPVKPTLNEYSDAEWLAIPDSTQRKLVEDDIALKEYANKLRARIQIHDEALQ